MLVVGCCYVLFVVVVCCCLVDLFVVCFYLSARLHVCVSVYLFCWLVTVFGVVLPLLVVVVVVVVGRSLLFVDCCLSQKSKTNKKHNKTILKIKIDQFKKISKTRKVQTSKNKKIKSIAQNPVRSQQFVRQPSHLQRPCSAPPLAAALQMPCCSGTRQLMAAC